MGHGSGAKFRDQYECISSSELTSGGREEWPDEKKDEQEYKLQEWEGGNNEKEKRDKSERKKRSVLVKPEREKKNKQEQD